MDIVFSKEKPLFFCREIPVLRKEDFFPDGYDFNEGDFRRKVDSVDCLDLNSCSCLINRFPNYMSFNDLDFCILNNKPLEGYDLVREKRCNTIYLRHRGEVIGTYQERVLYVAEGRRGQGFGTILILAKLAVLGARTNPDRPVTPGGGRALQRAYNWLLEHGYIQSD